jgi:UrcA family protein
MSSGETMENLKRVSVLALCALAGSTVSLMAPKHAAAAEPDSVTVSYRDLQLSRPSDARVLYMRLQRAAEGICGATPRFELERYAAFQRCVQITLKDAVARVNSPELERAVAESNKAGGIDSWIAQARR